MKALILAAGRGKRIDSLSATANKCMIPVGGRPVIDYSLDCIKNAHIDEIVIVVGYRPGDIINHLGCSYNDKKITYVFQMEQLGLVNAIECAREAIAGDDFLLLLGDEVLINPRHQAMIDEYKKGNAFAVCGVLQVDNRELIKRTYAVIEDKDRNIFRLIEKPRNPLNNIQGTGDCIFKNEIYEYIDYTPIHHERKEKELPDFIQCAIDDGMAVKSFIICDKYANINTNEDIEIAEKYLGRC